ncbi:DUF2173 family protein [Gammaproteobacteria bacterium]
MSNLDQLLELPGAIAAFEFNERGELRNQCAAPGVSLYDSLLDMLSHMCVANTAIAAMQARGWEQLTGAQGFYPVEGVCIVGLEWSVVSRGRFGVILHNQFANYEMAFTALVARGEA